MVSEPVNVGQLRAAPAAASTAPGELLSVPRTPSWLLIGGATLLTWVWLGSL